MMRTIISHVSYSSGSPLDSESSDAAGELADTARGVVAPSASCSSSSSTRRCCGPVRGPREDAPRLPPGRWRSTGEKLEPSDCGGAEPGCEGAVMLAGSWG